MIYTTGYFLSLFCVMF
uniref:Uncharacterized protein n=1 Tax=Anguilla anguilla TaxID=7936 RepID=A0A0E9QIF8_ANGAN